MAHTAMKLVLAAALIATAGCAKKKPADLPPPPPASAGESYTPPATGDVTGGVVPGSREDFLRTAGTDTVLFGTDSYDVDAEAKSILDKQAAWLTSNSGKTVTVEGHCDERGTREYNLALGDRRANAAKNYLVSRGISAARVSTISYGKERPVAQGSDEASWAQNRRAVTVLVN
jgi:peptidoglycan-associated lipoprotein